ncbi:MAG: hypothetical protein ACI9Q4_000225 [Sediminicola sp.]
MAKVENQKEERNHVVESNFLKKERNVTAKKNQIS